MEHGSNKCRLSKWGDLPIIFTSDPEIVIHSNECINLFLLRYFMSWTHNSAKSKSSIAHSAIVAKTVFSDLALWRHHSRSVASHERGVLALWRHIRRLFLHAPIGTKAIFTSE